MVMLSVIVEKFDDFVEELIEVWNCVFFDGDVVVFCIVEEVGFENCVCFVYWDILSLKSFKEEWKYFLFLNS